MLLVRRQRFGRLPIKPDGEVGRPQPRHRLKEEL